MDNPQHMPGRKLSETMRGVLKLASEGRSLYTYCTNRSEHGARTGAIVALRRRGLLDGDALTDAGRASIAAATGSTHE